MSAPQVERRPGGGTAFEAAGRPAPKVQPPADTSEDRRALAQVREVRRIVRRWPWRACGCGWRGHDDLCAWGLTAAAHAELVARLARDPFDRPAITADAELQLIVRVRGDREYAEAALRRYRELFGGTS